MKKKCQLHLKITIVKRHLKNKGLVQSNSFKQKFIKIKNILFSYILQTLEQTTGSDLSL